jgi:osomolarity two-component system, sensor histidine kinase NIK1
MTEFTLDSDLNRPQRESLLYAHSLARSLLLITNALLDISKRECNEKRFLDLSSLTNVRSVETGWMILQQAPFSLQQTVFGILKTLVHRACSNNLDLTYEVDPDIPDQLIGDSIRLQQVITNLVGNATKFIPSRGTNKGYVALSCRLVALDDSSVTLEFCVSDDGIGISKERLNLIFDALVHADGSTTRVRAVKIYVFRRPTGFSLKEYGGIGLGLSISKRLVALMGGRMWVESEVGKGSKFFFTTTSQIGQLSMDLTLTKMLPFENRNILFVDVLYDNTGVVNRIRELGLRPYVIHDPLEVADKATCPHIDSIVVDSLSVVYFY